MNRLSIEKRARIINLLIEGMSMRAIERLEGVGINTIARLLDAAGDAATAYHDEHVRGIQGHRRVECDEAWAFVYAKEKNVPRAKAAPENAGDAWTFSAIDAQSKLVYSYLVGNRDGESALAFMDDLRSRLVDRPQVSTDGLRAYVEAVEGAFGGDVDFGQIIKHYGRPQGDDNDRRYSPAVCIGVGKRRVEGRPVLPALQLLPRPQDAPGDSGNGGGNRPHGTGLQVDSGACRRPRSEAKQAEDLQQGRG